MTADDALQIYHSMAQAIFSKDNKKFKGQDGLFKATTLKEKVQEVVSKEKLGELMFDSSRHPRKAKAFVCAVPANNMEYPRRFRTYEVRDNPSANCKIWEAARATTAAPTFFKRIDIGQEQFIDGGLRCNNPAKQVLEEANKVFGNERLVSCLVSIGTGHSGTIGLENPDRFQKFLATKTIGVLKKIATDCEQTSNELHTRFQDVEKFYFRFNVEHGAETISLEEWEKMGKLEEHTNAYKEKPSVSKAINEVVSRLCHPENVRQTLGSLS